MVFIFGIYFFISALFDAEPYIPDSGYLAISIVGGLPDYQVPDVWEEQISGTQMDLKKIRQTLKMAAVDDRIKGIILKVSYVQAGYAKLQEIHQLIFEYRKSGKKILAVLDVALSRDYYLAAACDSIFIQPEGMILLTGVAAEVTFYKDLLTKIGIEADFEHIGKYKSYPETYTRNSMSSNRREVLNNILDNRYNELIAKISQLRDFAPAVLNELINNVSGFIPTEAIEYKLVDGIKHYDEVVNSLNEEDRSLSKISALDYASIAPSTLDLEMGPRIAIIYCSGSIMGGEDSNDPVFGTTVGANRIIRNIKQAARNSYIKAIIVRINSPGGSGIASERIWHALLEAKKEKPVVASISDLGASGGYFIAMAADTILAQEASLVGSIGVFIGKFSLKGLYDKIGISTESLRRGRNSLLFSLNSKFSDSERSIVQKMIRDYYQSFIAKVAISRDQTEDEIHRIAQGRVWTGDESKVLGLIDVIGGLDKAIEIAKEMAGIEKLKDPQLLYYPRSKSFFKSITRNLNLLENPIEETEKFFKGLQIHPLRLNALQN